MSKIKIFGLGGLAENGKNCYVVEIDEDIFIFDCGLKYATSNLFVIDYIMPDFSYLEKNRSRIKGMFITHGHSENMGSAQDLLSEIPKDLIKPMNKFFSNQISLKDSEKEVYIITMIVSYINEHLYFKPK